MSAEKREIWFPAKKYGWGWGFPTCWQGWAVLIAYFALLIAGMRFFRDGENAAPFVVYFTVISAALIAVSWWKGEPPRWRWGK